MPTKAHGPTQRDLRRMFRESKREGLANLVFHIGQTTIVFPLDGSYVEMLAKGQLPAPGSEGGGKPKLIW